MVIVMNNVEIRRTLLQDYGVSWMLDSDAKKLGIVATGEDNSGAVVLMHVPDDVVLQRAAAIRASKLDDIRGYVDQINGNVSSPILRFIYDASASDAEIDHDLDLIRGIACGLEPPSTACR